MMLDLLYVDDDDDIRHIVALSLSLDPTLAIRTADTGAAALALMAERVPDVAVLDVMMPGMDGPALFVRMRDDPRLAGVPVIFMTARGRVADIASYHAQGALGVILKPFDPVRLSEEVRRLLAEGPAAARDQSARNTP
jgi:DNA-binding response OmpR family regulator